MAAANGDGDDGDSKSKTGRFNFSWQQTMLRVSTCVGGCEIER